MRCILKQVRMRIALCRCRLRSPLTVPPSPLRLPGQARVIPPSPLAHNLRPRGQVVLHHPSSTPSLHPLESQTVSHDPAVWRMEIYGHSHGIGDGGMCDWATEGQGEAGAEGTHMRSLTERRHCRQIWETTRGCFFAHYS